MGASTTRAGTRAARGLIPRHRIFAEVIHSERVAENSVPLTILWILAISAEDKKKGKRNQVF